MIVLGCDTSTKTGLAVVDSSLSILLAEEVQVKKLSGFERAGAIAGRVMEVVEQFKPDLVVIENYGFANAHTLVPLVEIGTVVRYFLWQNQEPMLFVPPTSLKKFVTGSGNAAKDQMMMAVFKNWGHESRTNNIADAIGLAMFGHGCIGHKFNAVSAQCCKTVLDGQPEVAAHLKKYSCN